jgi:DNA-binding transcriptional regulator PaaX
MLDGRNKTKAEEVSNLITSELKVGDGAQTIEAFFERHDIAFSYNRFDQRYQAIIRDVAGDPKVDQAIVIHVYVDHQRRLVRSEVKDSFTGP